MEVAWDGRGVGCGVEKTLQGHGSLWVQQGLEDTGRPHLETFTFGKVVPLMQVIMYTDAYCIFCNYIYNIAFFWNNKHINKWY